MRRFRSKRVATNYNNTTFLKLRLQEEITKLERQLLDLRLSDDPANFSKLMSYQEMIKSRRNLLNSLPR